MICQRCSRWNLTPLEERWEAIEACERLYRDTTKRVATDEIGLAKVNDGLALVRIGKPVESCSELELGELPSGWVP